MSIILQIHQWDVFHLYYHLLLARFLNWVFSGVEVEEEDEDDEDTEDEEKDEEDEEEEEEEEGDDEGLRLLADASSPLSPSSSEFSLFLFWPWASSFWEAVMECNPSTHFQKERKKAFTVRDEKRFEDIKHPGRHQKRE